MAFDSKLNDLLVRLVELAHDAMYMRRFDGTIESWNQGAERLYGYTAAEAMGQNVHRLLKTEFEVPLAEIHETLRANGRWQGELRHRSKDGHVVVVVSRKQYAQEADGTERVLEANTDITHRIELARTLRESERRFSVIFDRAPVAMALIDTDGVLRAVNEAWEKMFGLLRKDVLGRRAVDLELIVDSEAREQMYAELQRTHAVRDWELAFRTAAGDQRMGSFSFERVEIDGRRYSLGIGLDITERQRVEQALRLSEEKFSKAFRGNTSAMAITRLSDGSFIDVNESWEQATGYSRTEIFGKQSVALRIWKNPSDRAAFVETLQAVAQVHNHEYVFCRRDGAEWVALVSSQLDEMNGEPVVISSIIDITERQRSEEELRRHELVVRQSRDVILFLNRDDGRIIEANPAAELAYGYNREELLRLTIADLRAPNSISDLAVHMQAADVGGALFETMHRRKDGSLFPVEVSSSGAMSGGKRTLVSVVRDISERKRVQAIERELRQQAERRAAELDTVFDALTEPLMVSDDKGRLIRANPAFEKLFGAAEQWMGMPSSARIRQVQLQDAKGEPVDPARSPGARALAGETVFGEVQQLPRPDGKVAHLATSSAPIRTAGGIVGAVVVFTDITERVRAERELREANQRKVEFLAVLSHELRNPLTPIRNSLYIIQHAELGSPLATRALSVIERQSQQLARMVDDLLDITRMSLNKIRLKVEPLSLNTVVSGVVEDYRAIFGSRGIDLELELCPDAPMVNGDQARLSQVLGNLLSNAAKFTPTGGQVLVVTRYDRESECVQLVVSDSGAGLEPDLQHRLFEPFMQAEMTLDRSEGGLGLGLALVKNLVQLHGGEVWAYSDGPGAGTDMTVVLPCLTTSQEATRSVNREPLISESRRVLVIEDQPDAADSLKEALEFNGHVVEVAYDGITGLAKARQFRPEVILCDVGLPGMDGYQLARAVRGDAELKGIYLIALTGYALPEDLEKAADAGFQRHVAKPPTIDELSEVIVNAPR